MRHVIFPHFLIYTDQEEVKKWVTAKLENPKDEWVISDGPGIQTQTIKLCFVSHPVETLMLKYVQPGVLANACF